MQIKNFVIDPQLKELTEHRTVVLPIAYYKTKIRDNDHGYIPLHWHEELQFILILKGESIYQVNEERIDLQAGEGLFINSGCLHMAEEKALSECVYICLNVSPQFIVLPELYPEYMSPYIQEGSLPFLLLNPKEPWAKDILHSVGEITKSLNSKAPNYEMDISIQLALIWKNMITHGFQTKNEKAGMLSNERMKKMIQWIQIHYEGKIMLEDIARAGQLSRSECCRYFKRILKKTPLTYVSEYRIQKSLLFLQQPETTVTEAAFQAGYNSTSHFIEKFKEYMNMTPLAYKRSKRSSQHSQDAGPGSAR
ncbi:AraC family transcriptional regulator [Peribacillus sp. SCS-26]|uniref:AraC family transcriptional regulator n=1 Tax=Paraperibacillus marinus TaxID=3115295 RepID=UPI0039064A47